MLHIQFFYTMNSGVFVKVHYHQPHKHPENDGAAMAPSFSGYERAVRAAGAEPVFYELSHDTGFGYETVCDRLSKMTVLSDRSHRPSTFLC